MLSPWDVCGPLCLKSCLPLSCSEQCFCTNKKAFRSGYYSIAGVAFHFATQDRLPIAIDPIYYHHCCPLANYLLPEEYVVPRRIPSIYSSSNSTRSTHTGYITLATLKPSAWHCCLRCYAAPSLRRIRRAPSSLATAAHKRTQISTIR